MSLPAIKRPQGEVLHDAILSPQEMAYMNIAREECRKLEHILLRFVVPALGGYSNEVASDIARHLEQLKTFSGNFCWKHRHSGSAHDATIVGGAQ